MGFGELGDRRGLAYHWLTIGLPSGGGARQNAQSIVARTVLLPF